MRRSVRFAADALSKGAFDALPGTVCRSVRFAADALSKGAARPLWIPRGVPSMTARCLRSGSKKGVPSARLKALFWKDRVLPRDA